MFRGSRRPSESFASIMGFVQGIIAAVGRPVRAICVSDLTCFSQGWWLSLPVPAAGSSAGRHPCSSTTPPSGLDHPHAPLQVWLGLLDRSLHFRCALPCPSTCHFFPVLDFCVFATVVTIITGLQLEKLLAENWQSFAGQPYHDQHGVIIRVIQIAPVCCTIVVLVVSPYHPACSR